MKLKFSESVATELVNGAWNGLIRACASSGINTGRFEFGEQNMLPFRNNTAPVDQSTVGLLS